MSISHCDDWVWFIKKYCKCVLDFYSCYLEFTIINNHSFIWIAQRTLRPEYLTSIVFKVTYLFRSLTIGQKAAKLTVRYTMIKNLYTCKISILETEIRCKVMNNRWSTLILTLNNLRFESNQTMSIHYQV